MRKRKLSGVGIYKLKSSLALFHLKASFYQMMMIQFYSAKQALGGITKMKIVHYITKINKDSKKKKLKRDQMYTFPRDLKLAHFLDS